MQWALLKCREGYPFLCAIYNLYFHPLSKIPGPRIWSASRLPYVFSQIKGTIIKDSEVLHKKYGPIVRVAPDEVSIARPDVWTDVLQTRQGEPQFSKDPRWWDPLPGLPAVGIFGAVEADNHARVRKLISPAFTQRTLVSQEPILQQYSSLLITRLRETVSSNPVKSVNVLEWFNFTAFDIFGDLLFAESFDCLHHSQYHAWMAVLFNHAKSYVFAAVPNYYPWLAKALKKLMPASMKEMIRQHHHFILEKLDRRFKGVDRPDAMSHIIKQMEKNADGSVGGGVSMDQLCTTAMDLVAAGSETAATGMAAIVNYLVCNEEKLRILTGELRAKFKEEIDITLDALKGEGFYLNAVISEGMRMAPPIPWLPPRKVPAGGRMICGEWLPENTILAAQIYLMSRDPAYFHSPDSFLPERWLPDATTNPDSPFFNDQRHASQPFSVGGKSCFGQHLAWAEMRLILAKFLWAFDIAAAQEEEKVVWEDLKVWVFWEKKPVYVRVKLRGEEP
ncbi:hypothetical protein QBC43DRAFT_357986 [Cladorrhinum sp. PSN259]|nr:hypothetical protein QBC43DRAFT_357986 [Cladorrhinum sp. PSN259]